MEDSFKKYKQYQNEFYELENKTKNQNKDFLFLNGDNVVLFTYDHIENYGITELLWAIGRNTKTQVVIDMNELHLPSLLKKLRYNVIIDVNRYLNYNKFSNIDNFGILSNDCTILSDTYSYFKKYFDVGVPFNKFINSFRIEDFTDKLRTLVVMLYIPSNIRRNFYKLFKIISNYIENIKLLNINDILHYSNFMTCVYYPCNNPINYNYLNLPLCHEHYIHLDRYLISEKIRDRTFDFIRFNTETDYRDSFLMRENPTQCLVCKRNVISHSVINVCGSCLEASKIEIPLEIMLGNISLKSLETKESIDSIFDKDRLRILKGVCPDCQSAVSTSHTFCEICEQKYDWNRIEQALDREEFSWEAFCNNRTLRNSFILPIISSSPRSRFFSYNFNSDYISDSTNNFFSTDHEARLEFDEDGNPFLRYVEGDRDRDETVENEESNG